MVFAHAVAAEPPGDRQITRGDDAFLAFGVGPAGQQVASDLFAQEAIVAQVAVERTDDPVSIFVRLRHRIV